MKKQKTEEKFEPLDPIRAERRADELAVDLLVHAPWNPRPTIMREDVEDLIASIKTSGLIQRIVVMLDPDDARRYIVIAGNRRLVACREAGLKRVPVDIIDCDVEEAKRKTLIENLQRKDVDPIMEADLIAGLVTSGMTEEQIAAETGRGNKWVWRRKQLQNLSEGWKKAYKNGDAAITVDCLEKIARHNAELQGSVLKEFKAGSYSKDWSNPDRLTWNQIRRNFNDKTRDLKEANFTKRECEGCPNNSANAPMLFDLDSGRGGKAPKFGSCLNQGCFERKRKETIENVIAKAKKAGDTVVEVASEYSIPSNWSATGKRTKENTTLYIYKDYQGHKQIKWGQPRPIATQSAEEKAEEKSRKKAEREEAKALSEARTQLADAFSSEHGFDLALKMIRRVALAANTPHEAVMAVVTLLSAFEFDEFSEDIQLGEAAYIAVTTPDEKELREKLDIMDEFEGVAKVFRRQLEDAAAGAIDDVYTVWTLFKGWLTGIMTSEAVSTLEKRCEALENERRERREAFQRRRALTANAAAADDSGCDSGDDSDILALGDGE